MQTSRACRPDPCYDMRNYHQGKGTFRFLIDIKTGLVRNILVAKFTGLKTLDDALVSAFRQWRMKPGTWKQFDSHVTFEMAKSREDALERIRRYRAAKPH